MCLGADIVVYYLLYEYLDAIIPNAYGIKKGCCCCLTYCRKKKVTFDKLDDEMDEMGLGLRQNHLASMKSENENPSVNGHDEIDSDSMILPQTSDILKSIEVADTRADKE